jgi:hypothetical protein
MLYILSRDKFCSEKEFARAARTGGEAASQPAAAEVVWQVNTKGRALAFCSSPPPRSPSRTLHSPATPRIGGNTSRARKARHPRPCPLSRFLARAREQLSPPSPICQRRAIRCARPRLVLSSSCVVSPSFSYARVALHGMYGKCGRFS